MAKNRIITVQDIPVSISFDNTEDYICITDMAAAKDGNSRAADVVKSWIRNRMTIEFWGTWEQIYNADFKVVEFDHFKSQAGLHTFVLSASEWINATNAIGVYVKKGRYGGTYAHKDIAFEFASTISPVFKLYLIKEFQRLKEEENNLQWLSHAEEADLLNVALFGFTAKAWREANPELAKSSNVRDYATINELTVLSNLESHNAQMLREGKVKKERFGILKIWSTNSTGRVTSVLTIHRKQLLRLCRMFHSL